MRNIASLILATVLMLSNFSSASAAEWYTKDANGRLTYHNDGRPGYMAPRVHRHQHHNGRGYHDRRSDNSALGVLLFGAGVAVGTAIANSQQQHRHVRPLSPREQCFESRGVWVFNPDTREELCALPY